MKINCRSCNSNSTEMILDLGKCPPANSYLLKKIKEKSLPLQVFFCKKCYLAQTKDYTSRETFFNKDYAYFSSESKYWLDHAFQYVEFITKYLKFEKLKKPSVCEIASNDGYLLKNFDQKKIKVTGVEPTKSTAKVSAAKGITTYTNFFSKSFSKKLINERGKFDLVIANNVIAHVPNVNDFVRGIKNILKDNGVATLEFAYLVELYKNIQFDTIYHEHYSYYTLSSINYLFNRNKLTIFKVQKLKSHGGSLRIFVKNSDNKNIKKQVSVKNLLNYEIKSSYCSAKKYKSLQKSINKISKEFKNFLVDVKKNKKKIIGYGAAAKASSLINFANVKNDLLNEIIDISKSKQGKLMPGSNIKIVNMDILKKEKFDYIIIFPWNIRKEIVNQLKKILAYKVKFVIFIKQKKFF